VTCGVNVWGMSHMGMGGRGGGGGWGGGGVPLLVALPQILALIARAMPGSCTRTGWPHDIESADHNRRSSKAERAYAHGADRGQGPMTPRIRSV
jgi:hypothetical protein